MMNKLKKFLIYLILFSPVWIYLIQLLLIGYIRSFPYEQKSHKGSIYTINLGFGNGTDFWPVFGLGCILTKDPCTLTIKEVNGNSKEYQYDLPSDIFEDYEEVWPEKQ